jgi:hypothetical protein
MATNLQFITSFQITSSQETTDLDNIFTNQYDVYKVIFSGFSTVGTSTGNINLRIIDDSGTVDTNNVYDYTVYELRTDTGYQDNKNEGFGRIDRLMKIDQSPDVFGSVLYVYNPKSSSTFTFFHWQGSGKYAGATRGLKGHAVHRVQESIRGLRIFETNGGRPYDTGKISIYGVQ